MLKYYKDNYKLFYLLMIISIPFKYNLITYSLLILSIIGSIITILDSNEKKIIRQVNFITILIIIFIIITKRGILW